MTRQASDEMERKLLLEKLDNIGKRIQEKQKNAKNENKFETSGQVINLPTCKDSERTIPNIITRSALFGVIKRGARPYKDNELIASRDEISIYYTGKALDQSDCTVWMQALAFAATLGKDVPVNRSAFLKLLGKTTGKKDYVWLNSSLRRLMTGVISIRTKTYELEFHLIDIWGEFREGDFSQYLLNINPKVIKMWANSEYTRVEWDKRLAIKRGCGLASWMQLYIRSNIATEKPVHISLHKLKVWCGRSDSELRKFRLAMKDALAELTRIGEIKDAGIKKSDMVIFVRTLKSSKQKSIEKSHRDSLPGHRDSLPGHRDSLPGHRDSLPGQVDRDSLPADRDSFPANRDSFPFYRDSLPGMIFKLLNLKKF